MQQKQQTNRNQKSTKPLVGGELDLQSYHVIKFKCIVFNKNHKAYEETGKYSLVKGKKCIPTETVLEKDQMEDLLHKVYKTILKILQELKEDIEKVKKMMCEQN